MHTFDATYKSPAREFEKKLRLQHDFAGRLSMCQALPDIDDNLTIGRAFICATH